MTANAHIEVEHILNRKVSKGALKQMLRQATTVAPDATVYCLRNAYADETIVITDDHNRVWSSEMNKLYASLPHLVLSGWEKELHTLANKPKERELRIAQIYAQWAVTELREIRGGLRGNVEKRHAVAALHMAIFWSFNHGNIAPDLVRKGGGVFIDDVMYQSRVGDIRVLNKEEFRKDIAR